MRRGSYVWLGAGLGVVTGLCVIALSYLAQQVAGLPFFAFTVFDWLARVLPGGVITLGIDSMVRLIVGLGLGPIASTAKAMEQLLGMVLWLAASAVIGAAVAAYIRRKATAYSTAQASGAAHPAGGAGPQAGAIGGILLAALALLAAVRVGALGSNAPLTLLWLVILVPGWGYVLGGLLERLAAEPASVTSSIATAGWTPATGPNVAPVPPATAPSTAAAAASAATAPAAAQNAANASAPGRAGGARPEPVTAPPVLGRRAFLARAAGGSLLLAAAAGGLGRLLALDKANTGAGQPLGALNVQAAEPATAAPAAPGAAGAPGAAATAAVAPAGPPSPGQAAPGAAPTPAVPDTRLAPAPGTRPEITPTSDFYRIDINLGAPEIKGSSWQLKVSGLFDKARSLTLADLRALPEVTTPITQSCISNPIGGDLISSAYYTGVRLIDVLQMLGLQPEAQELYVSSADGFYESIVKQDMLDPRTLLVYGMNGESLPIEHGYPLRTYIPNHYGMKQPKWITSIEAIDHSGRGYWVDRGWSPTAHPQVISIIDIVAKDHVENGKVPVGGIAWAGDRGIKTVQVQVDSGPWADAELRTPPIGPLMWVQWRYDWPMTPGRHTFQVRATDGKGAQQISSPTDTYPDGATGYHSLTESF